MMARQDPRNTARTWAWIALSLLAFLPAQVVTLVAADRLTNAASPERERVIGAAVLLGGLLMLAVVPFTGRVLGQVDRLWPGWRLAAPILLAALAAYVIVADVRSGASFETDHALPEIFLPYAVVLLASAAVGRHLARHEPGRRGWTWVVWAAAGLVVLLIGLALAKMATQGGDAVLDSPVTVATLAATGAYAVVAVLRARRACR
jgi:hypothetical protein